MWAQPLCKTVWQDLVSPNVHLTQGFSLSITQNKTAKFSAWSTTGCLYRRRVGCSLLWGHRVSCRTCGRIPGPHPLHASSIASASVTTTAISGHCQNVVICGSIGNLTPICLARGTRRTHTGVKIIYKAILTGRRKGQAGGFWDEGNILFLGFRSH